MRKLAHHVLYKPILWLIIIISLLLLAGCQKSIRENPASVDEQMKAASGSKSTHKNADVAIDWYNLQLRIILNATPAYPNTITIRLFGYTGISLYESVRYLTPHSPSLSTILYQMPAMPGKEKYKAYSWAEAANASLAFMTRKFFPALSASSAAAIDSLENAYDQKLMQPTKADEFNRSQAFGRAIAQAVFDWSRTDGFSLANAPYTPPVFAGAWVPTPPAFANAATPYFGNSRPFLQSHSSGLSPAPAFPYSELASSDFYKMVKDLYDVSKNLTTDQTNVALFWNDVGTGKGYSPSGHAINIINHILKDEHNSLGRAAQAYAKAGMGMWDAAIMCWRSKYTFNQLRPVTYIRKLIDSTWLPLIPTPPHPEFPAAHAYITTATMVAVAGAIGDKHYINDHTYDFLGFPARTYTSLFSIGVESGMSRRYGGIHYLPSINAGIALGKQVGNDIGKIELGNDNEDGNEQE